MLLSFNLLYFVLVLVTYGMNHGKLEFGGQLSELNDSSFLSYICKSFVIRSFLESFVSCNATIFIHKIMSLMFIAIMAAWF